MNVPILLYMCVLYHTNKERGNNIPEPVNWFCANEDVKPHTCSLSSGQ
jgi:hypothetical protein